MMSKRILALAGIAALLLIAWFVFAPPRFWLNMTKAVEPTGAMGAQLVEKYDCRSCHKIGNEGALKAPDLEDITQRGNDPVQVTLRLWLRDPRTVKGDTAMPNFHLSDSEIEAILTHLKEVDASQ